MILVTGGLGFIGAHTGRALLDLGERCVLAQRRTAPLPAFLAGTGDRAVVERMDCTDLAGVLDVGRRHEITGIVHLAATGMGRDAPLDELRENAQALFTVLSAARAWGVTRVVQASTIGVYAGVETAPYREDTPLPVHSVHPIPAFKKAAEILADAVAGSVGFDIVSVRIGAIWGPLGRPASPFFAAPRLVHAAVGSGDRTAADGSDPPYADDAIDMSYVRDCGRAIALLQTATTLNHPTYNIGGGRTTTNREVAEAIVRAVPGARPALAAGRGPHAPARDTYLDTGRLRADTGFEPEYDIDRAVADYVGWLRAGNPR
jgi:UDP-glucose 4-epimerase